MHTNRTLQGLAGLVCVLAGTRAQAQDTYERTMKKFSELRYRADRIQDRVSDAQSSLSAPSDLAAFLKATRQLEDEADGRLQELNALLAQGERDGSIGPETSKQMHHFFDQVAAQLAESREATPAAPAEPPAKVVEPKDGSKEGVGKEAPGATREALVSELEADVKEFAAVGEKTGVYGYYGTHKLLQDAFDKANCKCRNAPEWGDAIYLTCMNTLGAMGHFSRPYAIELARLKAGGEPDLKYAAFLRIRMGDFSEESARFLMLGEALVEHNVVCGQACDEGWYLSASHDEGFLRTKALERKERAIRESIQNLAPVFVEPCTQAEWAKLAPGTQDIGITPRPAPSPHKIVPATRSMKKDGAPAAKENKKGAWEQMSEVVSRSIARHRVESLLRGMEEKSARNEAIPPADLRQLFDNLGTLLGGHYRGALASLAALSANLETPEDRSAFFAASRNLVELSQAEGDAAQSVQCLRNFVNSVRPLTRKVPGLGKLLQCYVEAMGNSLPQITTIETRTRQACDSVTNSRREALEGTAAAPGGESEDLERTVESEDASLAEEAAKLQPAEDPAPAPPSGPTLNAASLAELSEILEIPRARVRGAEAECFELFQELVVARERVQEASGKAGADPAAVAALRGQYEHLEKQYRGAEQYRTEMRRAYQSTSDLYTQILLDRQH